VPVVQTRPPSSSRSSRPPSAGTVPIPIVL
jgi:hypothetical protein